LPGQIEIIGIYDNQDFSVPIEHTFDQIFSLYGVNYDIMPLERFRRGKHSLKDKLVISYGRKALDIGARKQIHIYASDLFGEDYLKPASLPQKPLKKHGDLPVIYYGHGQLNGWIREAPRLIETNIDIMAAAFFMLSRYEEIILDTKDEHDRFPSTASLAYQEGFLDRPIINEYLRLLWSWMHSLEPTLTQKAPWPSGKEFAICLTHDVDTLIRYRPRNMLRAASDILKSRLVPKVRKSTSSNEQRRSVLRHSGARDILYLLFDWIMVMLRLRKDPFDTFDYMLDMEQGYGFKSSFYFMTGGSSNKDNRYSIDSSRAIELVRQIEDRGDEVGLHASYNSYNSPEQMTLEKLKLDKIIGDKEYGSRQHYLRWGTPDSWRAQEKAGLLYDTTLSFADHAGFRCGICLPFRPFDPIENGKLNIWELPLTVMEGSLRGYSYQNLTPQAAYNRIISYLDTVKKYNGVFVLLWHNSAFNSPRRGGEWQDVYEQVMEYISRQNAWVTSGREIIKWWHSSHPPLV
jgi:hypothetical protein